MRGIDLIAIAVSPHLRTRRSPFIVRLNPCHPLLLAKPVSNYQIAASCVGGLDVKGRVVTGYFVGQVNDRETVLSLHSSCVWRIPTTAISGETICRGP